jgi:TPR repeat protein
LLVGKAYALGIGCETDLRQAVSWLRKANPSHNAEAAFELGLIALRPDNVNADNAEAFRWMDEAARLGHADAQYHLALFYWSGRGVAQDIRTAFRWAHKAALNSQLNALLFLSRLYEQGETIPTDRVGALALVKRVVRLAQDQQAEALLEQARLRERDLLAVLTLNETMAAQMLENDCPDLPTLLNALKSVL